MNRIFTAGLLLFWVLCALPAFAADPPPGPTALVVTAPSPQTIALSWSPAPEASSYAIYRDYYEIPVYTPLGYFVISSSAVKVATVAGTDTTFTDTNLSSLVRYHYAVTAMTSDGESIPSNDAFVTATAQPDAPIVGMADLHNHMFSNLGFGGSLFWGRPWAPGGISEALPACDEAHGPFGAFDSIGDLASGVLFHGTHGYPDFDGWPNWRTLNHQGMYIDWIERAFLGGVKLMVMHAVNNELLCKKEPGGLSCNDMEVAARQLEAANQVAMNVDWFKIAHTPAEARQIINSGRMAVVLGIEVDSLFDCKIGQDCTLAHIQERLRNFYQQGVRHIFPIHLFDNQFGGTALFSTLLDSGNKQLTGNFFATEECAATLGVPNGQHGFQLQPVGGGWLDPLLDFFGFPQPPATGNRADCNARGLTPLGASLVKRVMSRGMILDVDHMSGNMTDNVLSIAESLGYPVVSSHTAIVGIEFGKKRAEASKTDAQLARIHNLHGLVAPILQPATTSEVGSHGPVPDDCSHSSQQWAQAYFYAR